MAFKVNGVTVIDNARGLQNIASVDEGTAVIINAALPKPVSIDFVPDWLSPSLTVTGSGTWTKPAGMADDEAIIVYMVNGGSAGNKTLYSTNWGFGGQGGNTKLIFVNAGALNGASYVVSTTPLTTSSWQGGGAPSNTCTITISGTAYQAHTAPDRVKIWTAPISIVTSPEIPNSDSYISCSDGVFSLNTGVSLSAASVGGTATGTTYSPTQFPGGAGQGNYSTTGTNQTSLFAGDGGLLHQPGQNPGGGGGGYNSGTQGLNVGGIGSIRFYYASDAY